MAVAFDAVGPSSAGAGNTSTSTLTWTHTTVGALTTIVVGCSVDITSDIGVTCACTCDGAAMTSLGKVESDSATAGFLQVWSIGSISAGAHTILVTPSATPADLEGGSLSFTGAGGTAVPVTAQGTGTVASAPVTAATGSVIAGFTAAGNTIASSGNTSQFIKNQRGAAGHSTGNAAGATAAGTGSQVTMTWTLSSGPWCVLAVEVQVPMAASPGPVPLPLLPPGWFPGADSVTTEPGGIPFAAQPAPTDATPAVIFPATPEAAPSWPPPVPPGWFPGADRVTAHPDGIPFQQAPPPLNPTPAVIFPTPEVSGIADWQPLPPNWFPGASQVTTDPGSIPFYSLPQPLTPPPAPPPMPTITGMSGGTFGHFTDQFGNPRLWYNDFPFGLPANAGRWNGGNFQSDYDSYFTARAAQGFTTATVHPWGHAHTGCNNSVGNTWDGVSPWSGAGPASGLNEPFWTRIDYMFRSAAGHGITIMFGLTMACDLGVDAGFAGTGVWNGVSAADMQTAAQAIATRYAAQPNLLWMFGDDYNNNDNTRMNAVIAGIRAAGDTRPASIEYFSSGTTSRRDTSGSPGGTPFPWGDANASFNFCYSYWVTYFPVEFAYQETTLIPPVWGDGYFSTDAGTQPTDKHIMRNMVWWALASGARGVSMGSETLVSWTATSLSDVTGQLWYTESALAVYKAFTSLTGYQNLLPDLTSTLVTAGRGTRSGYASTHFLGANLGTQDYVCASITPDHSLAVIYCAVAMSITIDQTQLGAGYTATWIDPHNGATQAGTPGTTFASAGLGSNSAGDTDWVLALQGPPVGGAANVTGVAAAVAVAAPAGTFAAAGGVAGIAAPVTVQGGTGTTASAASVTGTGAPVTAAGGAGIPSAAVSITGTAAAVTVAGGAGTFAGSAAVTGDAAAVTVQGGAGTAAGGGGVNVTGIAAAVTVQGGTGTPASGAAVTGTGASVTVQGGTGVRSAAANVTGVAAHVTVPGGAGTLSAAASVTGTGASVTVQGGTGTPSAAANITGTAASVTVQGGAGAAFGGTSGAANVAGTAAAVTVASPAGVPHSGSAITGIAAPVTVQGGTGSPNVPVNVTGLAARVTAASPAGTAASSAGITGLAAPVTAACPAGTLAAAASTAGLAALITVLGGAGTPAGGGATVKATGTATVTAGVTSASTVTDPRDGTDTVAAATTSTSSIT